MSHAEINPLQQQKNTETYSRLQVFIAFASTENILKDQTDTLQRQITPAKTEEMHKLNNFVALNIGC